jgi:hypothetical protein
MARSNAPLRIVSGDDRTPRKPTLPEPEVLLGQIVPELLRAEQLVRELRRLSDEQRRRLAAKRGVAFIRDEHARREFGA